MRLLILPVSLVFGLDLLTTYIAFTYGATEANVLLSDMSFGAIATAKLVVLALVALSIAFPGKTQVKQRTSLVVAAFAVFATWGVTASNMVQLATYVDPVWAIGVPMTAVGLALTMIPTVRSKVLA